MGQRDLAAGDCGQNRCAGSCAQPVERGASVVGRHDRIADAGEFGGHAGRRGPRVARRCAARGSQVVAGDSVAAQFLVETTLSTLCHDLTVPTPLAYGIDRDAWDGLIPLMAEQALSTGSPDNNPVVPTAGQIETLYSEVFSER
ncbi:hypothetical protein ACWEK5_41560 [Rhodococcus koreensis]